MTKKAKINYLSYTRKNDIELKHRFGYRGLRVIGWISMASLMAGTILANSFLAAIGGTTITTAIVGQIFSFIGSLALPAFFIANFSIILMSKDRYKDLFIKYTLFILAIFILIYGFMFRYFLTLMYKGTSDFIQATDALTDLLNANPTFGVSLNMFIDLMLCLLAWFFLDYTPSVHFQDKKLIIFRLFVLFPVLYEVACVVLKIYQIADQTFKIPFYLFPLLTNKPPILFFVFIAIAIREKIIERKYLKLGHTRKEFKEYITTNAASKTFSKFAIFAFLIAAIIDLFAYVGVSIYISQIMKSDINQIVNEMIRIGIGKGTSLLLMIPVMHFYSYNKVYKKSMFDFILPIAGVVIVGIITIESIVDLALSIL